MTITRTYTNGLNFGKVRSTRHPNGTMELYEYLSAACTSTEYPGTNYTGPQNTTNLVWSGQGNSEGDHIIDGTKTVTVLSPLGEELSRVHYSILGTNVGLSTSNAVFLSGETNTYDHLGRVTNTAFSDGTFRSWTFNDCCWASSARDRDGAVTTYTFDALRRLLSTSFPSPAGVITTSNLWDAAGRLWRQTRTGVSGTTTSTITLFTATFDLAGRELTRTDALEATTTFSESLAPLVKTTTYPDGGTQVESRYLDGSMRSLTGTAVHGLGFDYGPTNLGSIQGTFFAETRLSNGVPTAERTLRIVDSLGRDYRIAYADGSTSHFFYNASGLLTNEVDPDGVTKLYQYNAKGEHEYAILDLDRDGIVDGFDRVTRTVATVTNAGNGTVQRVSTFIWPETNGTPLLATTSDTTLDGLTNWTTHFGAARRTEKYRNGNGQVTTKTFEPAGEYTVSVSSNGLLLSVTRYGTNDSPSAATTNEFDAHGRLWRSIDNRNGATTNYFDDADRLWKVVSPKPDAATPSQITYYFHDAMGRVTNIVYPDGLGVTNAYYLTGQLATNWGARTYPVRYTYDYAGRTNSMTTWTNFPSGGAATTTWAYDAQRGWLTAKRYPDPATGQAGTVGTDYEYWPSGRLMTRTWARTDGASRIATACAYNSAGDLESIDYSDETPDIGFVYDRLGRRGTLTQGTNATTLVHDSAGNLLSETYAGGPLDGLAVKTLYDQYHRRITNGVVGTGEAWLVQATKTYNFTLPSRLRSVADSETKVAAFYTYVPNSTLVREVRFRVSSNDVMRTQHTNDLLNRLVAAYSTNTSSVLVASNAYLYNSANQRIAVTNLGNSRWAFGYDSLGQLTNAQRFWSSNTAVAGQQFAYAFDDIGNRRTVTRNSRAASYTNNALNQITGRNDPGYLNILGTATNTATVDVNGQAATRQGEYWWKELAVNNGNSAAWQGITNHAVIRAASTNQLDLKTGVTGGVFLARSPEIFTFDWDGNLTGDGRWTNQWDGENRLVGMEAWPGLPDAARQKLMFQYDPQSRRTSKVVSNWTGSAWAKVSEQRFVYDGWNLMAILDSQSSILYSFTWGLDLSGTPQGAGGVGGLLSMTVHSGTNAGTYFYCYDGNGNVTALVNATNGAVAATYEYGPFGELLRATGPMAFINPFRFSTKYQDDETGYLYYGYRYYDPSTGRWLNRDPIGERGGLKLYGFVANSPVTTYDRLGLDFATWCGAGACYSHWTTCPSSCRCKNVTVTFQPGGSSFQWGWVTTASGGQRYGNDVRVEWEVAGEPKKCTYYQNESGRVWMYNLTNPTVDAKMGSWTNHKVRDDHGSFTSNGRNYVDNLGSPFNSPADNGQWLVANDELTIEFKCVSSDGSSKSKKEVIPAGSRYVDFPSK